MRDYVQIAVDYAMAVIAGEIPASQLTLQACERQIGDLQREPSDEFPYQFVADKAANVCRFIEGLPHIKGKWARARQTIDLDPWQCFVLTTFFGWVHVETGLRRFKTAYIEVSRKNAKSTLSAGVGLYCLSADGEEGAEVCSAATTRDQARIVFDVARRMVERTPDLREYLGVDSSRNAVFVEDTASSFKPLSRDQGGNHDGLNIHCAVIDELHAHKDRGLFDVLETATGARDQPVIWIITTAGNNRAGVCYEQRSYVKNILAGRFVDETYFGIIYTIDDKDDWMEPSNWLKANPNWGVSVNVEDFQRKAHKAMQLTSAQNNFLTKHLNVWVNADVAWMNMVEWDRCADHSITLEQFEGKPCHMSIDLSTQKDITALSIMFKEGDRYIEFHRYYLPEDRVEESSNSQYDGWSRSGLLTLTPGEVVDFEYIENDILEFRDRFLVLSCAYDKWQSAYLAARLEDQGVTMVEYPQNYSAMSEPMKTFESLVTTRKMVHTGCPVLSWMVSNVVAQTDARDNIRPTKESIENKIDGAVAAIMNLGRWMFSEDEENLDAFLANPVIG